MSLPVLTSRLLDGLGWVEHGFGTRNAALTKEVMASLKQIHSNLSRVADRPTGCVGEGDALLTDQPTIAVSVRTADCFPILVADPEHHAVAAVHAGWRGTAAGIVGETIIHMRNVYGTRAAALFAATGPGIGVCCYEVGFEVARQFGMDSPGHLDLLAENRKQLIAAGVPAEHIDSVGGCTFCEAEQFYSYRREGSQAGRMISFIQARA